MGVAMIITADELLEDRAVSFWLKNALTTALQRDAVDALHDANLLVKALENHLQVIFNEVG